MNRSQPNPNQAVTVEIAELRVDHDALGGSADALGSDVGIALERLIAERGLPARRSTAGRDTPSRRDDAALAAHVAESVWRQLVLP